MVSENRITRHVRISGYVQGVFYRVWARQKANELALSGWVRNRLDGTVEAVISGSLEDVNSFIEACRTGPQFARVDGVEAEIYDGHMENGFRMRSTR